MNFSNKQIWVITYPIIISLLMEHLINITDTIFLGNVGEVELGASAIASVYYMAIYMLGFGFSIGIQILIARRNGEKSYSQIGPIFQTGIFALVALAIIMFILSKLFTAHILDSLVSSEEVLVAAKSYLDWRVYGFLFSFVAIIFRAFYIGITKTKVLTMNAVVMVGSNIVLNYMLIFGNWGCPKLGIAGAAIGSSLAECISMIFYIVHTRIYTDRHKYRLFKNIRFNFVQLAKIWKVSAWTMLQSVLFPSQWFLFFIAVEHLGERPLAIANIIRSINTCFFMLIFAFADTTSSIVSNMLGAEKPKEQIIKTIKRVVKLTYIIGIPFVILTAIFPYEILSLYTSNESMIDETYPTMYVMLLNFGLSVPALIVFNVVAATGNTFCSMKIMLKTMAAYMLYVVIVVFYAKAEIAISWTAEYIYSITLLIFSLIFLKHRNWSKKI